MGLQSYALHSNLSKWTKGNLLERRAKVQGRQHHRYIYALAIRPWLLFPFLLALHAYSPPSKPRTQVKAACLNSHGYTLAISCAHLHLQRRQLPCALCVGVAAVPAVAVWGGGAQKGWRGTSAKEGRSSSCRHRHKRSDCKMFCNRVTSFTALASNM